LVLLNSKLKEKFTKKIEAAKIKIRYKKDIQNLAAICIEEKVNCITFNYDDLFDQILWEVKRETRSNKHNYWHPDGGVWVLL